MGVFSELLLSATCSWSNDQNSFQGSWLPSLSLLSKLQTLRTLNVNSGEKGVIYSYFSMVEEETCAEGRLAVSWAPLPCSLSALWIAVGSVDKSGTTLFWAVPTSWEQAEEQWILSWLCPLGCHVPVLPKTVGWKPVSAGHGSLGRAGMSCACRA